MGSPVAGRLVELDLFWRVEKASCTDSGIVAVVERDAFFTTVEWPTCALFFFFLSCDYKIISLTMR